MEYRYAIMPIVYSIKDINDMLGKRSEVYQTFRSKEIVEHLIDVPTLSETGLYYSGNWTAEIRSTVKTAYNRGALQRVLALTSFNPFKTAWELIPLSFVVDWFLNVGDVVTSFTGLDLSSQKVCCTSVKRTTSSGIFLFDESSDTSILARAAVAPCVPARTDKFEFKRVTNALLQEEKVTSYERFLWKKPTPRLTFSPFLNWKRFLDSLVLGYQPTKKLLRSL